MIYRKKVHRLLIFLLVIALALPAGYAISASADTAVIGVINANELYMRKGPSTSYSNITVDGEKVILVKGQEVTILGEEDGWYLINAIFKGTLVEGYSLGTYITVAQSGEAPLPEEEETKPTAAPEQKPEDNTGSESEEEDDSEYETKSVTYKAKYVYAGKVNVPLLNMRKSASSFADVITVLEGETPVTVINSTLKEEEVDGAVTEVRWYKIVAMVDGIPEVGYVMNSYIALDYSDEITAVNTFKGQNLRVEPGLSSAYVRNSEGKKVKLAKKAPLKLIGEADFEGEKWFEVTTEYNGETVTGYLSDGFFSFTENADEYIAYYKVKIDTNVNVEQTPSDTRPEYTFTGANAIIKDAAALAVKQQPKYSSATVMTSDGIPVLLYSGQSVEVADIVTDGDIIWCYVRFNFNGIMYTGYVNARYIDDDGSLDLMSTSKDTSTSELSFEAKLEKEGFPESYRVYLRELHAKYPLWEFKAYHTGLDWNQVIANESVVGKNLIPNTKSVEWKSVAGGAYSWKTDSFIVFDGSTWVTASENAIKYYMDPRNFLGENTIFQYEVLTYNPSYQDVDGVEKVLRNTALKSSLYSYKDEFGGDHTISYSDTFIMAAEYSGVSPLHLASRVKQEVTIGANSLSNSVTGTVAGHEGLYNFYNIGAYHSTEVGGAIANGLRYAKNGSSNASLNQSCMIPWTSPFRSILGGAFYIGNNYINRGQDTLYLQKFNVTGTNTYAHQYMANVEAPYSEGIRVFNAYQEPDTIPIVFSIPVYLNMPEDVCGVPEKEYNPNNWLKSLKVYDINGSRVTLTPTFDYTADCEYSIIVDSETDYLRVKTSTVSSRANVISENAFYPETGFNRFTVCVQAENGDIREYVINVVREEAPETEIASEEAAESGSADSGEAAESESADSGEAAGSESAASDEAEGSSVEGDET